MTCEETQQALSAYVDEHLAPGARLELDAHLDLCPACRAELAETRLLLRRLASLERPATPVGLSGAISRRLAIEHSAQIAQPPLTFGEQTISWLRPRVMPYTIGAFASIILFVLVIGALRSQMEALRDLERDALASNARSFSINREDARYDVTQPVTTEDFVASRVGFSNESPSLDPRGALAAVTWTPSQGAAGDDDMMVVADVYDNGHASLAEVVHAPRNPRMLNELQAALRRNPAFVPASLDHRPQTMRVVFVLQKVDVRERSY